MSSWDEYRYYLAVAQCGTLSAAARELGVSHATVLRHINNLEQRLGVKLFQRLQSGYRLSAAGERLYEEAREVESAMKTLEARVQGRDDALAGIVRVAQTENVVVNLYPLYASFSQQYPDIKLEVLLSPGLVNLNKLEADVAIRQTENPDELLVGRQVGKITFSAFAARSYLERFANPMPLSELDWVLWDRRVSNWGIDNSCFHQLYQQVPAPRVVMETSSYSEILSAIRAGMGAGFLSHEIAREYPDLLPLDNSDIAATTSLWVLTHRDLRQVKRVQCFMRFMSEGLLRQLPQQ